MAKVLSIINLKGGVGKSTLTVALAEVFAAEFNWRVLVVDLDPQTNATVMLIGEDKWKELNKEGRTIERMFKNALDPETSFDFAAALQKRAALVRVSNDSDGRGAEDDPAGDDLDRPIDLLPSSIDLVNIQDTLAEIPAGDFHLRTPVTVLQDAVRSVLDDYDLVLVDCPPNLGIVTLNGLLISDRFIIPAIPDILSTYGIPQIVARVGEFSKQAVKRTGREILPLGVVASKFRTQAKVHHDTLEMLRKGTPPCFNTRIAERAKVAEAAEYRPAPRTVKARWGNELAGEWIKLAKEIRQKLEAAP